MIKFLKHLEFLFDFYLGYFFYNGRKTHLYYKYMIEKYGEKYINKCRK